MLDDGEKHGKLPEYIDAAREEIAEATRRSVARAYAPMMSPPGREEITRIVQGWALAVLELAEWEQRVAAALAEHGDDLDAVLKALGMTREDWERGAQRVEKLIALYRAGEEFRPGRRAPSPGARIGKKLRPSDGGCYSQRHLKRNTQRTGKADGSARRGAVHELEARPVRQPEGTAAGDSQPPERGAEEGGQRVFRQLL